MFNPMTPAQLVAAMGRTARNAARREGPADAFLRSQLLSVFSASRHAAVELSAFEPELHAFAAAAGVEPGDARELGDAVCELLDRLRDDPSPGAERRRQRIRAALVTLVDREVELLADAIEGPP